MYKTLLINPRSVYYSESEKSNPSHYAGLLSILSILADKNHSVFLLDCVISSNPEKEIEEAIRSLEGEELLAGFSVMTSQIPHASFLSDYIRKKFPKSKIIWGGAHPTLFPEAVLESGKADFVCVGEGEYAVLSLLESLNHNKPTDNIPGILELKNMSVNILSKQPAHSLDNLPFFNYEPTNYKQAMLRTFSENGVFEPLRYAVILTGVGCPYKCTFCINSNKNLYLGRFRRKSAERIIEEIEFQIKKYSIECFEFLDDNFFIDKNNVKKFLSLIEEKKLNFKWFTNIRADYFREDYVNKDFIKRLEKNGCQRLAIGAESGSQRILDKLKKSIKIEQILNSAKTLADSNIKVTYSFMMGLPGEEKSDVDMTLSLIEKIRKIKKDANFIGPQIFRPYPGGELYEECVEKYGYRPPQSLSDWENNLSLFSGYEDLEKLTWIKDKNFIRKVSFYLEFANLQIKNLSVNLVKKIILYAVKYISLFRIKNHLWELNFEMFFIGLYKKLFGKNFSF